MRLPDRAGRPTVYDMNDKPTEQDLPARDVVDARDPEPAAARPLDQVTGAELTTADLDRTLVALRSLSNS